jgi:hypothetical protein
MGVQADLVDEVESLTGSRTSGGSEPGDALRVSIYCEVTNMTWMLIDRSSMPSLLNWTSSNQDKTSLYSPLPIFPTPSVGSQDLAPGVT